MRLFSRSRPKIDTKGKKRESYDGWTKCEGCAELIHEKDLEKNLRCCSKCGHHYRMNADERIANLTDPGTFKEMFSNIRSTDALKFVDTESYKNRLKSAQKKSGLSEGFVSGSTEMMGHPVALGILDFRFMGGSMGSVVGERLTRLIEYAIEHRVPLIVISSSGGARMQESVLSLMQMAKTSAALAKLHEARLPFISVLTHPTTGGVTASFAALGDVIIAEPNALICFAGPRVIEQTIKEKLPPGAQRSEFLLKTGMIDCIVRRHDLRKKVSQLIDYLHDAD